MEVIKHGKKFMIVNCPECECEFRFNEKEILTKTIQGCAAGYYSQYDYVECPECGYRIILADRAIEI